MTNRTLTHLIKGIPTSDGAGVKLVRSLGSGGNATRIDPFLMLDEFSSDHAEDYIAGFPAHPHRGFETVTYILDGHMLHEDHMGNKGDLTAGSVQWMSAGRGVIHSEMPQQSEGRLRGFQLWLNLPASEKMKPAAWRDISASEIPSVALPGAGQAKVIAGALQLAGHITQGPINTVAAPLTTDPLYLDVQLPAGAAFEATLAAQHNAFVFVFEGAASLGGQKVPLHHAGRLSQGEKVVVTAGQQGTRMLLLAARPLNEPVVQYGPFVMNTREEIEQAMRDYAAGTLT